MSQIVSEQLIGGILEKARGSASAIKAGPQAQETSAMDFRQSQQLARSMATALSVLQEAYARRISDALGSLVRVALEAKSASAERVTYSEFAGRIPSPGYLAQFRISSLDTVGLIQVDLPLVFQILDLMLGGFGAAEGSDRGLTEIEDEIFQPVAQLACQQLQIAWRPVLDLDCRFEKRIVDAPPANLMPGSEMLLLMTFEITIGDRSSKMTLAFSSAVSTRLFRELSARSAAAEPVVSHKHRARIQEILLDSRFEVELALPPGTISVGEVFDLQPGSLVVLQARASEPIHLRVADRTMFLAVPARCGTQRAAKILRAISISSEKEGK